MKDEIARDIVEEIMTRIHAEEEECSRETSDKEEEAPVEIARDIVEEIMTRIHERDGAHNDAEEEECSQETPDKEEEAPVEWDIGGLLEGEGLTSEEELSLPPQEPAGDLNPGGNCSNCGPPLERMELCLLDLMLWLCSLA